ncbi:MAG: hypothetical protein WC654_06295 [Patescibacteria group bacterium]
MKKLTPDIVLMVLMIIVLLGFAVLNVLHFGGLWSLNTQAWWRDFYELCNALAINLLAAYFFYLLIVQLFVRRRRHIIKANLQKQYQQFKQSVIGHFLGALNGSHSPKHAEQLCELSAFRDYFYPEAAVKNKEPVRWFDVINEVQSNEYLQHELIVELSMLRDEVSFVLSNVEIHDEGMFEFFKRLQRIIYRHEHGDFETDDFKSFMQFFFELFTGWSFITGYAEKDIVQSFIDNL